jgi:hypothetical protein
MFNLCYFPISAASICITKEEEFDEAGRHWRLVLADGYDTMKNTEKNLNIFFYTLKHVQVLQIYTSGVRYVSIIRGNHITLHRERQLCMIDLSCMGIWHVWAFHFKMMFFPSMNCFICGVNTPLAYLGVSCTKSTDLMIDLLDVGLSQDQAKLTKMVR